MMRTSKEWLEQDEECPCCSRNEHDLARERLIFMEDEMYFAGESRDCETYRKKISADYDFNIKAEQAYECFTHHMIMFAPSLKRERNIAIGECFKRIWGEGWEEFMKEFNLT